MSNEAIYWGTGRRKNAVARVHIVPGTGKVTVNKRDAVEYFGRQQLVDMALMPLKSPRPRATSTSSPCATAAASPVRPALCVWALPALFSRLATTVLSSRRLATSPAMPAWSSVRSTASRRLVSARSSPSAKLNLQLLCTRGASPCVGLLFCFLLGSYTSKWRVLAP